MRKSNPLVKELLHYLLPSVASLVSLSCYILADTFFIAVGVGPMGLTGLNIALPAYSLINATGLMLGVGAGIVVSISKGRGEQETANTAATTALLLAFCVGLAFTALGVGLAEPIAQALGASTQALPHAGEYIRVISSFSVFFLLNNTLVALVRNDGNPSLAMTAMIVCSMSNVALDALFLLVFDWGMAGAAFATGLAPVLSLLLLSQHWLRGEANLLLQGQKPSMRLVKRILSSGSASFVIELGNGIVILLFNFTLLTLSGDLAVAAYGIVANIALVAGYVFIGVGQGIQPLVGRLHGANDEQGARSLLHMSLWLSVGLGVLFCTLGFAFPAELAALFNREKDPALAAMSTQAIRIYFTAFLCMGANVCCMSYFQSVQRPKLAAVISLLRGFVLVVAGVALLPGLAGLNGVWLIVPFAELCTLPVCLAGLWKKRLPCRGGSTR